MKLVTVAEMKRLEQAADAKGHSFAEMMEQAGRAVALEIAKQTPVKGKIVLVLVGPGNNGGDGLVAARYLKEAGAQIVCYMLKPRPEGDTNLKLVQEHNIACLLLDDDREHKMLRKVLQSVDIIIDALLGTGVSRPIDGALKDILDVVRQTVQARRPAQTIAWTALAPPSRPADQPIPAPFIVAIDTPSGLNCDTGEIDAAALTADLTIALAAPKRGHFRFPGAAALGRLVVADIGIDPGLVAETLADIPVDVATAKMAGALLPERPPQAHKGTFGKAMVVAGSVNYTGAPYLAAAAAARVGAGLVTLAPPQPLHAILAGKLVEATFLLLPHSMGVLNVNAVPVLSKNLKGYTAMLLGPGLGQDKETVSFVHKLLDMAPSSPPPIGFRRGRESSAPITLPALVIDADGLNALAKIDRWWEYLPPHSILTPHPGEMARLTSSENENRERIALAAEKAAAWQQIVVLKGAYTVIAAPDGAIAALPFANPALSTAGSGDVLAGCIVGLLAQGLAPFEAAVCGAYLHGLAGARVAARLGVAGTLAGDLLPELPGAIASLKM